MFGFGINRGYDDAADLATGLAVRIGRQDVFFFCIGTNNSIGDSFGPLVGTFLKSLGYENVLGTIEEPVHALNLEEKINLIPAGKIVIAIDACLSNKKDTVGSILLEKGSISPGAGVGKKLLQVGDFGIKGLVVQSTGNDSLNDAALRYTRLDFILRMAQQCTEAINLAFPLNGKVEKVSMSALYEGTFSA